MNNNKVNEAKDMAEDLHLRILQYKKVMLDPEATLSVPSIEYMSNLAEGLCKKLNELEDI